MERHKAALQSVGPSARPVILVGGGGFRAGTLAELAGTGLEVAAADSGADAALAAGITPALIAGDMDSISSPANFPRSRVVETPDQDRTDFEKTLEIIDAPLVIALGFLGKRFDHAIAAINVLAKVNAAKPVILLGDDDAVFFAADEVTLELAHGARVSVWPLTVQGFASSKGLEWPLTGITLEAGGAIGTSNRVSSHDGVCTITPDKNGGGFFVAVDVAHLDAVVRCIAPDCLRGCQFSP